MDFSFHVSQLSFQKQFVTVSRDTKAYVWKLEEGKREFELFYNGPNGQDSEDAFRIRACRYIWQSKKKLNIKIVGYFLFGLLMRTFEVIVISVVKFLVTLSAIFLYR